MGKGDAVSPAASSAGALRRALKRYLKKTGEVLSGIHSKRPRFLYANSFSGGENEKRCRLSGDRIDTPPSARAAEKINGRALDANWGDNSPPRGVRFSTDRSGSGDPGSAWWGGHIKDI